MSELLRLALAGLATWRVTHLIVYEDGPWDLIARLRGAAGSSFAGKLMDCFYCSSLWVSAAVTLLIGTPLRDCVLVWLGLSGAACVLNRVGTEPVVVERLGGGIEDGVLRTESGEGAGGGGAAGGGATGASVREKLHDPS